MIPNMADCDFYRPVRKEPSLEKKFGVENRFVVSYIGAAGYANGLDYFLECANLARKQSLPVHFILCGEGAVRDRLKGHAEKLGLLNISFIGLQNRKGVKEIMNVTDAVFVCYKNVSVLETGSPNKFFDGLAAGKLIITNFGGWIKSEIEDNQCGFTVDPQNPADFTRKLRPFLDDGEMLNRFQQEARRLAEKKYARTILSEKFAKIFS